MTPLLTFGAGSVGTIKETVAAEQRRVSRGKIEPVSNYQAPGANLSVRVLASIPGSLGDTISGDWAQIRAPNRTQLVQGGSELDISGSVFPDGNEVKIKLWNLSKFPIPQGAIVIAHRDNQGLWVCDYSPPSGHILVKNNSPDYIPPEAVVGIDLPVVDSPVYGESITVDIEVTQGAGGGNNQKQTMVMSAIPAFGTFRLKMLNPADDTYCYSQYLSVGTLTSYNVADAIDDLVECLSLIHI
jgi:hypothetical protein